MNSGRPHKAAPELKMTMHTMIPAIRRGLARRFAVRNPAPGQDSHNWSTYPLTCEEIRQAVIEVLG